MGNNWESESLGYLIPTKYFYRKESEKTLGNWFLYELTNGIYAELVIYKKIFKKGNKNTLNNEALNISLNIAKCIKMIMSERKSLNNYVIRNKELNEKLKKYFNVGYSKKILEACYEDIELQLTSCKNCPSNCLYNNDVYCYMFDNGPY